MNSNYKIFTQSTLALFLILLVVSVNARTTITAISTGDWTTGANWDTGTAPQWTPTTNNSDDIIIDITGATGTNGSITLNGDLSVKTGTTITIKGCDTLIITGNVTFANGSVVQVDPCAVLIIQGNLTNNNNSNQITIDGGLSVGGDFTGGNGSVIDGAGTVDISGTISGTGTITAVVLSVDLTDFIAVLENNRVYLTWRTLSEINSEKFIIERSVNQFEWEELFTLSAAGTSTSSIEYSISDNFPLAGQSFYRIKEVDFDGKTNYYGPVSVYNSDESIMICISPNLTYSNHIRVLFNGFRNKDLTVAIMDIDGRICFNNKVTISSNTEYHVLKTDHSLTTGIYILTAYSKNEAYSQKIIIK